MSDVNHKECYGTMFPDPLHCPQDQLVSGKVFAYQLSRAGGLFRSDRAVEIDIKQWDDCLRCEEFDHCYKLCLGKLSLQAAIVTE